MDVWRIWIIYLNFLSLGFFDLTLLDTRITSSFEHLFQDVAGLRLAYNLMETWLWEGTREKAKYKQYPGAADCPRGLYSTSWRKALGNDCKNVLVGTCSWSCLRQARMERRCWLSDGDSPFLGSTVPELGD